MISTFKKYWSRLKNKVCPALLLICLISCVASPFASAADYTGSGSIQVAYYYPSDTYRTTDEWTGNLPVVNQNLYGPNGYVTSATGDLSLVHARIGDSSSVYTTPVSLYLSAFAYISNTNYTAQLPHGDFSAKLYSQYLDSNTDVLVTQSLSSIETFTPDFTAPKVSEGFVASARFNASSDSPISVPSINSRRDLYYWAQNMADHNTAAILRIVSFRAVATATTAELEGLEAIADSIVAQSEMMQAFYGDIVSVCNQIYSRLGDMQSTAELANVYFQQMITLLQHIDSTTVDIYNLLPSQFAMLETAIDTASTDIVAAVQAQTNALIAYFDSVFSGAVGTLPDKSDDLETEIGNVDDAESEYKSNASATFEQLSTEFTGFTGGTLSGIALASNLFTQVWNALGEYSVVYSFPLLFGLCLLLIGRLSKYSGGQSSTDKERGDSDA